MTVDINKKQIITTVQGTEIEKTAPSTASEEKKLTVEMDGQYYSPAEAEKSQTAIQEEAQKAEEIRTQRALANQSAVDEVAKIKEASIARETVENKEKSQGQVNSGEIDVLADKNKTIYEKTSVILDDYIKNHPDEYPQYANMSEKQKSQLRDKIMTKINYLLTGKSRDKRTKEEHKLALRDLATLVTVLDSKNVTLKDVQNGKLDSGTLHKMISNGEKNLYDYMLNKIDLSNPDKALNDIAELYLTFTDEKFLTKEGQEKVEYMKTKQNDLLKMLGIKDTSKIPDDVKSTSASVLKSLLVQLSEKGMTLKDFYNASAKIQNDLLIKALDKEIEKNPEKYEKYPEEIKTAFKILKARNELIQLVGKDNPTERDLLEKLKELEKSGELSPEYKELLDAYKNEDKLGRKLKSDTLGQTAKIIPSTTVEAMIYGKSYQKHFEDIFKNVPPGSEEAKNLFNEAIDKIINEGGNPRLTESLWNALKANGWSKDQLQDLWKNISPESKNKLLASGHAHKDAESVAKLDDIIAETGTPDMIETTQTIVEALPGIKPPEFVQTWVNSVQTTIFDRSVAAGINKNYDVSTANKIFTNAAKSRTTAEGRSSIVQQSLLTTTDVKRIQTYVNSYQSIKDVAVTEGMAAASHNSSSVNIKAIIDSGVDYAVKNNGYSSSEIKNIQTARETGVTSFERAQKSETANSSIQTGYTDKETSKISQTQNTVSSSSSSMQAKLETERQSEYQALVAKKQNVLDYAVKVMAQTLTPVTKKDDNPKLDEEIQKLQDAKTPQEVKSASENIQKIVSDYQKEVQAQETAEKTIVSEQDAVSAFVAEIEKPDTQNETKYNVSPETIREIKTAYSQGGLVALFDKICELSAVVGSDAQQRLLNYIAHTDSSTLHSFANAHSGDKNILMALYNNSKDPVILRLLLRLGLGNSLIGHNGITVKDFLAHADKDMVANWIQDLAKSGSTVTLNSALEMLSDGQQSAVKAKTAITKDTKGGDEWLRSNNRQAILDDGIAMGSTKVSMGRRYDKKVKPFYYSA